MTLYVRFWTRWTWALGLAFYATVSDFFRLFLFLTLSESIQNCVGCIGEAAREADNPYGKWTRYFVVQFFDILIVLLTTIMIISGMGIEFLLDCPHVIPLWMH